MTLPVLRSGSTLGRWDPFREFEDLYQQMGRLMETSFGGANRGGNGGMAGWAPLADLSETEDAYLVEVDLPGVKRDDVSIEQVGNELSITGEFKERERTGWLRSRTRRVGRFEYRTTLPHDVDSDKIEAELTDGVLTVRVPKTEAAKPRRIAITAK